MGTYYKDGIEQAMAREFARNPELAKTTAEVLARLRRGGYYEQGLVDAIGQPGTKYDVTSDYTVTDAFAFLLVYSQLVTGTFRWARICAHATPYGDRAVEENNAGLAQLSPQFYANFVGGAGDHDGDFGWYDHIHLGGCINKNGRLVDGPNVTVKASCVPLEVGTQSFAKTWVMLRQNRGVARWPYGSEDVWLLCDPETFSTVETDCMPDEDGWPCARVRQNSSHIELGDNE